jgi:hypothetical protein
MFFIMEFRGTKGLHFDLCQNFPGKTFQGKLSRGHFPVETFSGET